MDNKNLRKKMLETQLILRGIRDQRVLEAFGAVEREKFVPDKFKNDAYGDFPLSIGHGQTISQPYMVACMTEQLGLRGNEKVLEIGTGSGYQTAILAKLAEKVYSIERIPELAEGAKKILEDLGYNNIEIKVGDGTLGWREYAPYDAIIVTAGAPDAPQALIDQLAERGRLVIPIGDRFTQMLTLIEKKHGKIETTPVTGCMFVPLIGKQGWGE